MLLLLETREKDDALDDKERIFPYSVAAKAVI